MIDEYRVQTVDLMTVPIVSAWVVKGAVLEVLLTLETDLCRDLVMV